MQAPTTLTRDNRFNRMTAGAIGLAVLAASVLGAVALNERVELPLLGDSSEISAPANTTTKAKIEFFEQNRFDYAAVEPTDPLFLEENSWDYQPAANYASVASIRLIEENSFDYATSTTSQQIQFQEENGWDYQAPLLPPADSGASDY